jgi:type IV secretory pathway VirB2 component (pilin)
VSPTRSASSFDTSLTVWRGDREMLCTFVSSLEGEYSFLKSLIFIWGFLLIGIMDMSGSTDFDRTPWLLLVDG